MSIHFIRSSGRYVVRVRDGSGRHRNITVNPKNLLHYDVPPSGRITERVARRLEQAILAAVAGEDSGPRDRGKLLWLETVARYLPALVDDAGQDTWQSRPAEQPLENEKHYSRSQLDRMQRVLTVYFPAYLGRGKVDWQRRGQRQHGWAGPVHACSRPANQVRHEDVVGVQICLEQSGLAAASVRGYMSTLKTFLS